MAKKFWEIFFLLTALANVEQVCLYINIYININIYKYITLCRGLYILWKDFFFFLELTDFFDRWMERN